VADVLLLAARLGLVAILYLFLLLVARAVWRDLRAPQQTVAPPGRSALARLVVIEPGRSGLRRGEIIPLQEVNTIGRAPENSIALADDLLSAAHALLTYRQNQWWIEDLGSTNGTFVNNMPVKRPVVLANGDILTFGQVRMRLERAA
jgi:hypothetical protein